MYTITGDLVKLAKQGMFDAIVHGCNCFCNMGAGIAKQIKEEFPEAFEADKKTISGKYKLGQISQALIKHGFKGLREFIVINAYTQYGFDLKVNTDYNAIKNAFRKINTEFEGMSIGIPRIGAGLGGGDWDRIKSIIQKATPNVKIILVEYEP